ncbi:MnmC family methyltransferase [Rubripirellula amarantea]|nr:MnmC family methyltransferase [Rubripirellula amarantea]
MNQIPIRPTYPSRHPALKVLVTDDGSRTLVDPDTQIAFHSGCGAIAETRHVYLNNSMVATRLGLQKPTQVLEFGLGTGMAMFMTLDFAMSHNAPLTYVAIDRDWLSADVLPALILDQSLAKKDLVQQYSRWRSSISDWTTGQRHVWHVDDKCRIDIVIDDFAIAVSSLVSSNERFEAIYFDPFDPAESPEAWTPAITDAANELLTDDGYLTTYCVNRNVRDTFALSGFDVYRVPGPHGGKRQVMVASKTKLGSVGNANLKSKAWPPVD